MPDYSPAKSENEPETTNESTGSSDSSGGGKPSPDSSVRGEVTKMSLRRLGEELLDRGLELSKIKEMSKRTRIDRLAKIMEEERSRAKE